MAELGQVALLLAASLLIGAAAVRVGILIGRRLDRAVQPDDEDPE